MSETVRASSGFSSSELNILTTMTEVDANVALYVFMYVCVIVFVCPDPDLTQLLCIWIVQSCAIQAHSPIFETACKRADFYVWTLSQMWLL